VRSYVMQAYFKAPIYPANETPSVLPFADNFESLVTRSPCATALPHLKILARALHGRRCSAVQKAG
jgi:hypothetical protein